jgi:GLPGLI family protein
MKRIIIVLGILVSITAAVFGQITEGVITYETKVNMHRNLAPERQEMKHMIPEFRTTKETLIFNANESLFKPMEEEASDEDLETGNGGGMRMMIRTPQNEWYVDQANSKRTVLQEFMGKKYLIEDSLKLRAWKFGNETKQVSGYDCKQATFYNEERKQTIVVWYTDKLRPFLGPESFNTLPGAVLQVDINDGERVITAQTLQARSLKKNELKLSTGGIKTTEAEFAKIRDEQLQRMRANGANVIIR